MAFKAILTKFKQEEFEEQRNKKGYIVRCSLHVYVECE